MKVYESATLALAVTGFLAGPLLVARLDPAQAAAAPRDARERVARARDAREPVVNVMRAAQDRTGWPSELRFGIIPAEKSDEMAARFKPLMTHLEQTLGLKIKPYYGADYATVTVGMRSGTVDLAYLGPLSYVLAAREAGAQAFAKENTLKSGTGNAGVIVSRADSGIKTLSAAKGKTFAFVDPQSATGYLLPMIHFVRDLKVRPEAYFKAVKFGGTHEANIESVIEGDIQVAATDEREIDVAVRDGEIRSAKDLTILWTSERVPTAPLAYRKNLPASLKTALQKAVLSFNDAKALERIGLRGFVAATDAEYDIIRKLEAFKKTI